VAKATTLQTFSFRAIVFESASLGHLLKSEKGLSQRGGSTTAVPSLESADYHQVAQIAQHAFNVHVR